jgi:hypothetical protein
MQNWGNLGSHIPRQWQAIAAGCASVCLCWQAALPVNLPIVVMVLPFERLPDSCNGLVQWHKVRQRDEPITVTICKHPKTQQLVRDTQALQRMLGVPKLTVGG